MKRTSLLSVVGLVLAVGTTLSACDTSSEHEAKVVDKNVMGTAPAKGSAPSDEAEVEVADPVVEEPVEEETPEDPGTATIGDTVAVGDWEVKILTVETNANAKVHAANMFNDKPKGQYVLVTYAATYTGADRIGDRDMDLSWSFTTTDSKVSDVSYQVTPADNQDWPTQARKGGTIKGQTLFDLKAGTIKGGTLTVEGYDDSFETVYADFTV